jgi:nitroreductase
MAKAAIDPPRWPQRGSDDLSSRTPDEGTMNETVKLMQRRRSVAAHLLGAPGPNAAEVETLLTIAARVPDHGRLVPWRFVVIEGEAQQRIGDVIAAAFLADQPDAGAEKLAFERTRLARAPLVIAVVSRAKPHVKIPRWEQVLSAGAVCANLLNAATALGYGATWITEWYAYDRRVLDALGLAPDERIAGFLHIGTILEAPVERPRPELAAIITRL